MSIPTQDCSPCSTVVRRSVLHKLLTFILLLGVAGLTWAQVAGTVTHLTGTLVVKQADGKGKLLSLGSELRVGEILNTQQGSFARVRFTDGGEVVLRPNSQLAVTGYAYQPEEPAKDNMAVGLIKGGMRMVTGLLGKRNPQNVEVKTVTATIGIRGTHFGLLLCQGDCTDIPTATGQPPADGLHADVVEGVIHTANPAGELLVRAGEFGYVADKTTPPRLVRKEDGVQVTIPESISLNSAGGRSVGETREDCNCTVK